MDDDEAARRALLDADVVCPHDDADGLAAGALALRARSQDAGAAVLLGPEQTPWGAAPDLPDASVALLDQGVRPFARRGVLIDHHVPETPDPGPGVVVRSSFGEAPEVPTAPLVRRLVDGPAWLAAVGAAGDLGKQGLALPECRGAPSGPVQRLVPLVNAPRRVRDGPVRTALAILLEAASPAAALRDPRIAELEAARDEAKRALDGVRRTAPRFIGDVAVLRIDVPALVHPLVAATWTRRLAPHPVLCANDGWLPGHVTFSVRCAADVDLRALLRTALPDAAGELGHGHRAATGGRLAPDDFERLLEGLARTSRG